MKFIMNFKSDHKAGQFVNDLPLLRRSSYSMQLITEGEHKKTKNQDSISTDKEKASIKKTQGIR